MSNRNEESRLPNPWAELAARPHLLLHRAPIAEPARYYDRERAIVLRTGLTPVEERRFLWHELVHADRRDRAKSMTTRTESYVDREAARRAMPATSLQWAAAQAHSWPELAALLQLPEGWVRWRFQVAPVGLADAMGAAS